MLIVCTDTFLPKMLFSSLIQIENLSETQFVVQSCFTTPGVYRREIPKVVLIDTVTLMRQPHPLFQNSESSQTARFVYLMGMCTWLLASGCLLLGACSRLLEPGCLLLSACSWVLAPVCLLLAAGTRVLASGCLLLAAGTWLLAPGCWDPGCLFLAAGT